jgi:hypothetical protein
MLEAIVAGETDPVLLADLAKGRLRAKRALLEQALQGIVRDHHRFLITNHLLHGDFLDEQIATFNAAITQHSAAQTPAGDDDVLPTDPPQPNEHAVPPTAGAARPPDAATPTPPAPAMDAVPPIRWEDALTLLDTIPGVGPRVAEIMLAEIGPDMARFPNAAHLARWARVCPGNHERAGKRSSGKTGKGNPWLRSVLIQAAHAAVKARDSWFGRVYRRLVPRLGVKKAIVAIAHRLIIAIYHRLRKQEPYREPTTVPDNAAQKLRRLKRLQQQVEALGGTVSLPPVVPLAA